MLQSNYVHILYVTNVSDDNKEEIVFLDVGANIGVHALTMASLGHQVWAVEPLDVNLRLVKELLSFCSGKLPNDQFHLSQIYQSANLMDNVMPRLHLVQHVVDLRRQDGITVGLL